MGDGTGNLIGDSRLAVEGSPWGDEEIGKAHLLIPISRAPILLLEVVIREMDRF
jgi:hypothetical protein